MMLKKVTQMHILGKFYYQVDTDQECAKKCTFDGSCFAFSRNMKDNSCYVYTSATIDKNQKQQAKDNNAYKRCLHGNSTSNLHIQIYPFL